MKNEMVNRSDSGPAWFGVVSWIEMSYVSMDWNLE